MKRKILWFSHIFEKHFQAYIHQHNAVEEKKISKKKFNQIIDLILMEN
jgi:HD superfamily phosphohydrolase